MQSRRQETATSSPRTWTSGVKPRAPDREEKSEISIFFEDLSICPRVDVVVLPEAPFPLREIVSGEILTPPIPP